MIQDVTIEKMVFGGLGLAFTPAGALFVEDVLPGEHLKVSIQSKKHGCTTAKPVEFYSKSPLRREPSCPLAGDCGGCNWLHIDYNAQLQFKKEIFLECLLRIGHLRELPEIEVYNGPEYGYRMRAQIKIDEQGRGGFFRKKTNSIVSVRNCPLLSDELNRLLLSIDEKECIVKPGNLKVISGSSGIASLPVLHGFTNKTTEIHVGKYVFTIRGEDFFQSNRYLLEKMGSWGYDSVQGDLVVDLYGGTGFFSVMLHEKFSRGLLIESIDSQVQSARKNFAANGISNFEAVRADAENFSSLTKGATPDLLIVDPPRPGLTKKAREQCRVLNAKKILYVSCNSSTQARDVSFFVHMNGYRIEKIAFFDLYPNTYHLETAILLVM
ncbi:MAG: class I SAM-dependent RNA methyltransferase [Fibrobacter sp.]|nr:class I SAM-dependent RNA methyltransferase [Fibrobacter sp.]